MSKQTDRSLFIVSSVPRLYQAFLGGITSYKDLGNRIIKEIKAAQAFRQVERVAELSQILVNNPIKEYQLIGQYYLVWSKCKDKEYDTVGLENIIDQISVYKAQALLTRGTFEYYKRSGDTALYFYNEALKARPNISQYISISVAIAVIKSLEGFHKLAVRDLEKLLPIVKYAEPKLYYDFLNSLAVELAEVGREYEARNIIQQVLESPLVIAYPEWQETAEELKGPNRSFFVIDPSPLKPRNVLAMPAVERDQGEPPIWAGQPAPVVSYQEWKVRMAKKKKRNGDKTVDQMDVKDMFMEIMNIYTSKDTTDAQRRTIYFAVMKALSEPTKPDTPESPDGDNPGA